MNLVIKEYNKKYEIGMGNIVQVLGVNFKSKEFIYQSIIKHFSLYKYQEYDEYMENNITIDGEVPGRREYRVIGIESRDELIDQIRNSKNTIIYEYLVNMLETLSCQKQLNSIDENLTVIYNYINEKLSNNVGGISIEYEMQNLLNIISKSEIYSNSGEDIETMSNYELLIVLLNLIKENNTTKPEKVIILLKNVDHLCNRKEYKRIIEHLIDNYSNIYIMLFISIDKYVYVNKEIVHNIIVLNDMVFQVPKFDAIEDYLVNHYPVNYEFSECEILGMLKSILNMVGIENENISYKEILVKKLINKAICINDRYDFNMKSCELACLNDK